jgi:outer membrane protein TolC
LAPAAGMLPGNVDEAVDLIDQRSPRMAQAVEDRKSLQKQYASQTGAFLPHVSVLLQGNHKYDVLGETGMSDDARAMVQVTYNLFNGGADLATRHRIGARLREADYELDRRRREVEQDIRTDFDALGAARQKIATITAEIESAQKVVDLYRQQFREGKRTVFEVLDSEKTLYGAKANQISNRAAMNLSEYRVLQKLGGLFELVSDREPLPPLVTPAPRKK